MGQVRDGQQRLSPPLLDPLEFDVELDALRPLAVRVVQRGHVEPLPPRPRKRLPGRILVALDGLDLRQQSPAARLERRQRLDLGRQVDAAAPQAVTNGVEAVGK